MPRTALKAPKILSNAFGSDRNTKIKAKVLEQKKINPSTSYELVTYVEQSQRYYVVRLAGEGLNSQTVKTPHLMVASDWVRKFVTHYGGK